MPFKIVIQSLFFFSQKHHILLITEEEHTYHSLENSNGLREVINSLLNNSSHEDREMNYDDWKLNFNSQDIEMIAIKADQDYHSNDIQGFIKNLVLLTKFLNRHDATQSICLSQCHLIFTLEKIVCDQSQKSLWIYVWEFLVNASAQSKALSFSLFQESFWNQAFALEGEISELAPFCCLFLLNTTYEISEGKDETILANLLPNLHSLWGLFVAMSIIRNIHVIEPNLQLQIFHFIEEFAFSSKDEESLLAGLCLYFFFQNIVLLNVATIEPDFFKVLDSFLKKDNMYVLFALYVISILTGFSELINILLDNIPLDIIFRKIQDSNKEIKYYSFLIFQNLELALPDLSKKYDLESIAIEFINSESLPTKILAANFLASWFQLFPLGEPNQLLKNILQEFIDLIEIDDTSLNSTLFRFFLKELNRAQWVFHFCKETELFNIIENKIKDFVDSNIDGILNDEIKILQAIISFEE